ncbi:MULTISPECIES: hypothetical protein [unclassified Oscillibacter]|uniref:hypothetical protein n=1 Tax=unclassified Oscillibacter TaxID=2629304 RepID=UPI0025CE115E|nr:MULTISPECIES: hypothetical protein [unclassified Oscillibacter]
MNKQHPGKLDKSRHAEVRRGGSFARLYEKPCLRLQAGFAFSQIMFLGSFAMKH